MGKSNLSGKGDIGIRYTGISVYGDIGIREYAAKVGPHRWSVRRETPIHNPIFRFTALYLIP